MSHLLGTPLNPLLRIRFRDPTANLHAALPYLERLLRCGIIARTQHYHVCARKFMLLVQRRVVRGGVLGGPIRSQI